MEMSLVTIFIGQTFLAFLLKKILVLKKKFPLGYFNIQL